MRLLFLFTAVLLLAAFIWLGIAHADRIRCRLTLNKAIHEFSIREEDKAIERAIALLRRKPDYRPAREAAIGWLTARNEFARARTLASDPPAAAALSPLARYQLGVCAYETGDEQEAVALFESIDLSHQESRAVPAPLVQSCLYMARGDGEAARTALESVAERFEADPFYHSLFGRAGYARGDVVRAAEQLDRAVALGECNPRARLSLAVCRALLGDSPAMERRLDELATEGVDAYRLARREVETWGERLDAVGRYVSPTQQATLRDWTRNLRLARVAIDIRQRRLDAADETLDRLARDFPDRLGLVTLRGLLWERRRDPAKALEFYREEAARFFLAAYKVATLEPNVLPASEDELLAGFLPAGSEVLDAVEMNATVGAESERGWILYTAGDLSTTFSAASTGRYAVDLLARGDPAAGIWPIVIVFLDGERVAERYINTPVWNLFELHQPLLAGPHSIRVLYINNAVPPGVEEDRNFYLDKVIVRPVPN